MWQGERALPYRYTVGEQRSGPTGERPLRGPTSPSPAGIPSGTCPTGNLPFQGRHGLRAAFGGWPWGLLRSPLEERFTADLQQGFCRKAWALPSYQAVRPRSKNSGVMVRLGPISVSRPTNREAQTAAGPRGRRYLPKTARRCNWRAHFGPTGLKACPFAACLSFCEGWLLFFCVGLGGADLWF